LKKLGVLLLLALTFSSVAVQAALAQEEDGMRVRASGPQVLPLDSSGPPPSAEVPRTANAQAGRTVESVEIGGEPEHVPGEIVVLYDSKEAKAREKDPASKEDLGGRSALLSYENVKAEKNKEKAHKLLKERKAKKDKEPGVEWAGYNTVAETAFEPSDPYFRTGAQQPQLRVLDPMRGWDLPGGRGIRSDGSRVVVGVVDSGIDASNPDICSTGYTTTNFCSGSDRNRINGQRDFVNGDANAYDDDESGHGTHVSGMIMAKTNNGYGMASGSFESYLIAAKVVDAKGNASSNDTIAAINWLSETKGADVINVSIEFYFYNLALKEAVDSAYDRGTVVVAAAGNHCSICSNPDVAYPAGFPKAIAVGSVVGTQRAEKSNYGSEIDVVAGGENVTSTIPTRFGANFGRLSGTSFAAPQVSALAANLKSRGAATQGEVRRAMFNNADDLGPAGLDNETGYGRVDYYRALKAVPYR